MRTEFDFTPLFRSTVGFDRMLDALLAAARVEHLENYPLTTSRSSGRTNTASRWR
ncbi:hypothetical protein ACFQU2_04305 [Siccirubricoccus deserti]